MTLIFAAVAAILALISLFQSEGRSLLAWAVLALAMVHLWGQISL